MRHREACGFNFVRTSSVNIQQLISQSSFVITRFSSLIYEALALGRPVVYFNPHGERYNYDFEFDQKHLILARSAADLERAIPIFRTGFSHHDSFWENYAWRHSAACDGKASERVAEALDLIMHTSRGLLRSRGEDLMQSARLTSQRISCKLRTHA